MVWSSAGVRSLLANWGTANRTTKVMMLLATIQAVMISFLRFGKSLIRIIDESGTLSFLSFLLAAEMGESLAAVELGTNRYALKVKCGHQHTCALLVTIP